MTEVCSAGFPHSDISGSLDICSSPKLFAAYHVFHRLLVPRHPPYALSSITNLLRPRVWTPLHISSVICVGNSLLFLFVFSNQFSFLLLQASMITSDVLIFFLSFHFCMRFSRYVCASAFASANGDGEIRTLDPLLARQALSQLSYTPK